MKIREENRENRRQVKSSIRQDTGKGESQAEKYYGREMGGRGRNTIGRAGKI